MGEGRGARSVRVGACTARDACCLPVHVRTPLAPSPTSVQAQLNHARSTSTITTTYPTQEHTMESASESRCLCDCRARHDFGHALSMTSPALEADHRSDLPSSRSANAIRSVLPTALGGTPNPSAEVPSASAQPTDLGLTHDVDRGQSFADLPNAAGGGPQR